LTTPQRAPFRNYLSNNRREIIEWINGNVRTYFNPTGEMYDRLANQVREEFPYGQGIDNMHRFLTNAIMTSLWCGWFSQAATNRNDPNFSPEFIERFRNILSEAYELGRQFAPQYP
jgi:hypothetical protein